MASRINQEFQTTQWGLIATAADGECDGATEALQALCSAYWYPVYAHVRRQGQMVECAEDLTQEFFCRMVEKKYLKLADRTRGRFRTFLLTSLKHFLISDWEKGQTIKRGGQQKFVHLDEAAESLYLAEGSDGLSSDAAYDKRWAVSLLKRVLSRLREEYEASGKGQLFENIKGRALGETATQDYRSMAEGLLMTEGALRVAAHRLRERYRELLHIEVSNTVAKPEEVDDELRHLISVLRG
jgi:RNA polymerase sigma-70 factor (ECF subfamily)